MIVNTVRLLRRCQLGKKHQDTDIQECAKSLMSYLVPRLWEDVIAIPDHLEPLYMRLPELPQP